MNQPLRNEHRLDVSPALVQRTQEFRSLRPHLLGPDLFSDPAWDILLELFRRELTSETATAAELAAAARVSEGVLDRWCIALEQRGLVTREKSPFDRAASRLSLTKLGSARMRRYFVKLASSSSPL